MFIYSVIKIIANSEFLYLVLKPGTNSDSPSLKSNGARCVSARIVRNHIIDSGSKNIIIQ